MGRGLFEKVLRWPDFFTGFLCLSIRGSKKGPDIQHLENKTELMSEEIGGKGGGGGVMTVRLNARFHLNRGLTYRMVMGGSHS